MSGNEDEGIKELKEPCLILCEGEGDSAFFRHLIEERRLAGFEVHSPRKPLVSGGGRQRFGQLLTALKPIRGYRALTGIIVVSDNDDDPETSFGVVADQIAAAEGYARPEAPLTVIRAPEVAPVVVMMIPWTGEKGTLESLCLESASAEYSGIAACLDEYVRCTGADHWNLTKQLKMRMRCMLSASCERDPNTSLVHAWSGEGRGRLIPLDHGCFDRVADFLRGFDGFIASH